MAGTARCPEFVICSPERSLLRVQKCLQGSWEGPKLLSDAVNTFAFLCTTGSSAVRKPVRHLHTWVGAKEPGARFRVEVTFLSCCRCSLGSC